METYDFSNLIAETYVIDVDKGCISYTSNKKIQQGEHRARLIQGQLVKEGIPVDLTNCNVYFYTFMPQHQDKPTVTKCEIYDATQGMVTVKIEEYMSRNAGTLECEFERIGMDRTRLPFKKFQLSVDGSISANDAIENSEPLSALVDALAQVTEWDYQFEEKYNGLEREYAQELTQTKQELAKTNAQLSEKIYKFDAVSDMKNYNFKVGDVCETLGYYVPNDGGSGLYCVRRKVDSEEINGFNHLLKNDLVAELIIKDSKLNFRQLGAVSEQDSKFGHVDCKPYLEAYLTYVSLNPNKHLKLVIPSGIWVFSETLINTSNIDIEGELQFFNDFANNGTIITALTNQNYVWKLGDDATFDYTTPQAPKRQINIGGLTFSSGLYTENTKPTTIFSIEKSALYIDNVCFCHFKTLNFNYIHGTALAMSTCWELYFDILNFRFIFNHSKPCMVFDDVHTSKGINYPNISALEINSIMFEACNGDYIKFSVDSAFDNNTIHHISIEGSFANGYQDDGVTGNASDSDVYQNECVFRLGQASNVIIESINTQLIGAYYHECNGIKYCRNIFFNYAEHVGEKGAKFKGVINNITLELTKTFINLVNQANETFVNFDNKLVINNVLSHSITKNGIPKFNLSEFTGLYIDNIYSVNEGVNSSQNNLMNLPYNYCFLNSAGTWANKTIVSDNSSNLPINLCVKKTKNNNNSVIMRLELFKPSVISILAKIPINETPQVSFSYKLNGTVQTKYLPNITGTGEYKWYDFDVTEIVCDTDSYLHINCSSQTSYFALYFVK